ncbi:MAG: hypothetical protein J5787_03480 [Alphaproteobacteria bacterium]|nr:hypothetical protein [Alphaproteobacteria bacterium]
MKKYLFLLIGLLAFTAYAPVEASVFKLGRHSLKSGNSINKPNIQTPEIIIGGGEQTGCGAGYCKSGDTCIKIEEAPCEYNTGVDSGGYCVCQMPMCSTGEYLSPTNGQCTMFCSGVVCNEGYVAKPGSDKCCCESSCSNGYSYNSIYGGCVKDNPICSPGCQDNSCGTGSTLKPLTGYFISDNGTCPACSTKIANCATCKQSGSTVTCLTCNSGYTLKNGQCEINESTCPSGQVYHPTIKKCIQQKCVANCNYCHSTEYYCITCNSGYYLSYTDGTCPACSTAIANCTQCSSSSTGVTCSRCASGYTLENGQCVSNTPTCPTGYVYHPTLQKCIQQKCVANCANCHSTEYYCIACSSGYYLNYTDGTCPACSTAVANCTQCSSSSSGVTCSRCASGYTLKNGQCVSNTPTCASNEVYHPVLNRCVYPACFTNCAYPNSTCEKQIQLGYCPACASGHYMEYNNGGCPACSDAIAGCTQCTSSNGGNGKDGWTTNVTCTNCSSGYTLRNGQCVSNCPSGQVYHPALGTCVNIGCPANCADGCSAGYCTACKSGYTLNNRGECVSSGLSQPGSGA